MKWPNSSVFFFAGDSHFVIFGAGTCILAAALTQLLRASTSSICTDEE